MGAGTANRTRLQGDGWHMVWEGDRLIAGAIWAAMMGIDQTNEQALAIARQHPFWDNDTGQTEAALFMKPAVVEVLGTTPASTPHVWGMWGVAEYPHLKGPDADREVMFNPSELYLERYEATYGDASLAHSKILTTLDVALFLEFGTVNMAPRPWLYPAWDHTKHKLGENIARWTHVFESTGRLQAMGPLSSGAIGRPFMSLQSFLDLVRRIT